MTAGIGVAVAVAALVLADTRVGYLMGTVAVLGVALVSDAVCSDRADRTVAVERTERVDHRVGSGDLGRSRPSNPVLVGAVVLGLSVVVLIWRAPSDFEGQVRHYGVAAEVEPALRYIADEAPEDASVAVPPVRTAPLGWWVEGLGRRSTLVGSPLEWLHYPDERERAVAAAEIFGPGFPTDGQLEAARRHGVDLILVPAAWGDVDEDALRGAVAAGELIECSSDGGARLFGTAGGAAVASCGGR